MRPEIVEHRMETPFGEAGSNAREMDGRSKELFAERPGRGRVVTGAPIGLLMPERFEGLTAVIEAGRQDRTVADWIVAGKSLLDDEAEGVAFLQREEVD